MKIKITYRTKNCEKNKEIYYINDTGKNMTVEEIRRELYERILDDIGVVMHMWEKVEE